VTRRSGDVVAILTRLPVPGRTKTRLIPALGPEGAAALQREMTAHTLRQVRLLRARTGADVQVWFDGGTAAEARAAFGRDVGCRPQPGGDLGERIGMAVRAALVQGADRVVVIGCDCPSLDARRLAEAFDALDDASVVVGPAADGGYYLLGVRADAPAGAVPAAVMGIPWGSGDVFATTVEALRAVGAPPALLPTLSDVDEPADLPVWEAASQPPRTVSVVIAALNEADGIGNVLERAFVPGVQVIVADGGSTDGTAAVAVGAGATIVRATRGRARQFNAGAAVATGDVLVFLHADTMLPEGFEQAALGCFADPGVTLGAFTFATDWDTPTMRLFARGTGWRARRGLPWGDQAMMCRRADFEGLGGFRDIPLMEDHDLASRARRAGRVRIMDAPAVTSARAWREHGPWRWMLLNRATALGWRLGVAPERLAAWRRRLTSRAAR
jgi:rSAM/selenodomain-associated transferase 2/rSAM/selenodomain-associated transferase 1